MWPASDSRRTKKLWYAMKQPVNSEYSMPAHLAALRKVGVPYTDEQIAKASEEVKGKTELDAVIAYLQALGLALR